MEPRIPPGSSDVCQGMSNGAAGQFHPYFEGLYGSTGVGARPEYAASTGDHQIPSFMSSLMYPMDQLIMAPGTTGEEEEEEERLDRATAASRNHREAEKRRRERIKSHLDRLRSILACDAKIEKASLLAKAVEHVRDLKQRAAEFGDTDDLPTETDEISAVYTGDLPTATGRRPVLRASLCCEDRSSLLPELAETLKSLRLRVLRAEIATLGGRVRNVLVVAGDDKIGEEDDVGTGGGGGGGQAAFLRDALVERPGAGGLERPKRRRVLNRSTTSSTAATA